MSGDAVQPDLEYGSSRSSRHGSLSYSLMCAGLDLMSGLWTVHSFSDPGGFVRPMIHDVAISSPQSMYVSESVIEEKGFQGE